ncbi:MAG: PQQ-binding-like beta-propeller repeat protein [Planctomycetota bacterium]
MIINRSAHSLLVLLLATYSAAASASDWPMWRCDAGRSAAGTAVLPENLQLCWTLQAPPRIQAWDDPLNLDLMPYDRLLEPIVVAERLILAFSDTDRVCAFDTASGRELWSFITDAPVRLPPAGTTESVCFVSDDGYLYCVNVESGQLRWKFLAAPGSRRLIGNQRLISTWPARGGVVIRDGIVYFASSIWPMMGVSVGAVEVATGRLLWLNDSTGSTWIRQPHSAPSFAGVAPQGALVAVNDSLIVPGGRSVPAVFNRSTGALNYFELNAGGKGVGGSFVIADDHSFFVHTRQRGVREFNLSDGAKQAFQCSEPVLHNGLLYSAAKSGDSPVVKVFNGDRRELWDVPLDASGDLILSGGTLYAAGAAGIQSLRLPADPQQIPADAASQVQTLIPATAVNGRVERLLAAGQHLFAVTAEGHLHALSAATATAPLLHDLTTPVPVEPPAENSGEAAEKLLRSLPAEGYALWFGTADSALVAAVAERSPFVQLACVDEDLQRVTLLRDRWTSQRIYGKVTVHHASPDDFATAPYLAHCIVVSSELSQQLSAHADTLKQIYQSVRPYGGVLQLLCETHQAAATATAVAALELEKATLEINTFGVRITRTGALPDTADWTHLHGSIANTRKSNDARVRLPLGVLWFGGSSNLDVLPRHGHGPGQQVVEGRLFIQGINTLSARDVYTGRVLWRREFEDLGTYDVYYDATYRDTPLDPAYNQVHIPGANARGTNYVATPEHVYILEGAVCRVLDPATGHIIRTLELPQQNPQEPQEWSYLGVYQNVLIGGVGFARYRQRLDLSFADEDSKFGGSKAGFGSKSLDRAGSLQLVGFDRFSGRQLWTTQARHSFWNNGVIAGGGRVYCLDRNPRQVEEKLQRRGIAAPDTYRILAIDALTGKELWQKTENIFGTWLGYSEQHDLLLQAGAAASDRLAGEPDRGLMVCRGSTGEVVWHQPDVQYSGPCILHNDLIIANANSYRDSAGAWYLKTGQPWMILNPLTGIKTPFTLNRAYGCNTILASENFLTFRSGAAGFYDLTTNSGTGNFGGFRSGCSGNLVAANGVLNAPDYTRTCSCSYQNQTSLALVHMPEVETWTVNALARPDGNPQPLVDLGINFGAPGHRRDDSGTLWIEWPAVVTDVSPARIAVNPEATPWRRHSSAYQHTDTPWINASGLQNVTWLEIEPVIGGQKASPAPAATSVPAPAKKSDDCSQNPGTQGTSTWKLQLHFADPSARVSQPSAASRRFDVLLNGNVLLENIEVQPGSGLHREVEATTSDSQPLRLEFRSRQGSAVISGLRLQRTTP